MCMHDNWRKNIGGRSEISLTLQIQISVYISFEFIVHLLPLKVRIYEK